MLKNRSENGTITPVTDAENWGARRTEPPVYWMNIGRRQAVPEIAPKIDKAGLNRSVVLLETEQEASDLL
jgi:hypothetical protein